MSHEIGAPTVVKDPQYVGIDTVCQVLNVRKDTVYRWAREGKMGGAYRFNGLWRFDISEVVKWAASCLQLIREPR